MSVWNPSGGGNVHIDKVLTNISVGWPNGGLVGGVLFPVVSVRKQSDIYYVFGREEWRPERGDERAPGAVANEIPGRQVSTTPYYAKEHSLQIPVTDEERENADSPLSPDRDGTELVTAKIMLGRELIMRDIAVTAANYASGLSVDLGANTGWDQYAQAGSVPITDIKTGIRAVHARIFLRVNIGVLSFVTMSYLEDHPSFLERIKYSERAIFSPELLGSLTGITRWEVAGGGYDTAQYHGVAESLAYIWSDDVVLAYVPQRPGLKVPAYGYEFQWGGQMVDRWREEPRKSDLIRVSRRYDVKNVALDGSGKIIAGYLIKDVISPT
jgi:hypothetical protein